MSQRTITSHGYCLLYACVNRIGTQRSSVTMLCRPGVSQEAGREAAGSGGLTKVQGLALCNGQGPGPAGLLLAWMSTLMSFKLPTVHSGGREDPRPWSVRENGLLATEYSRHGSLDGTLSDERAKEKCVHARPPRPPFTVSRRLAPAHTGELDFGKRKKQS